MRGDWTEIAQMEYQSVMQAFDAVRTGFSGVVQEDMRVPEHDVPLISKLCVGVGPRTAIIAGTHSDEYSAYNAMTYSMLSLLGGHEDILDRNAFDFYVIHPLCSDEHRMRFEREVFAKNAPSLVIDLHTQERFKGFFIDTIISHDWDDKKQKRRQIEVMTKPILRYAEKQGVRLAEFEKSPLPPLSIYDGDSVKKGRVIGFIHQGKVLWENHHLYGDTGYMASKQGIPAITFEGYRNASKQLVTALDGVYEMLKQRESR